MAERRMFTKKITDDDNFIGLSSSAQALYLHLMMSADDDGFNNQVSVSMFRAHASVGDLEALLEKRYLYQFENGVIVIKHWRMANALRKDRYTPTTFQEEFKQLKIKENGSYTLNYEDLLPSGCQVVAERLPQDSIGKNSKDNNTCSPSVEQDSQWENDFEIIYESYPKKGTKQSAKQSYHKWVQKSGRKVDGKTVHLTNAQIWDAVQNYKNLNADTDMKYWKNFSTLMNQILDFM